MVESMSENQGGGDPPGAVDLSALDLLPDGTRVWVETDDHPFALAGEVVVPSPPGAASDGDGSEASCGDGVDGDDPNPPQAGPSEAGTVLVRLYVGAGSGGPTAAMSEPAPFPQSAVRRMHTTSTTYQGVPDMLDLGKAL